MSGISSQALPSNAPNRIKFNGYEQQNKEFSDGSGLEWYDYKHRFYDNQIGRFFTQDGLAHEYVYYSPYQFAGNEVPNAIDLDGLEPARHNDIVQRQQASKKQYEQAYNQSLQSPRQNNSAPLVTFTAVLTKGDVGTAALEANVMNVKVGMTSSNNERDVIGVRDNQVVINEINVQTLETQTRNGASVGTAVIGFSDQETTTKSILGGRPKTESVSELTVGPLVFNNKDETRVKAVEFKGGFMLGYEASLYLNLGSGSNGAMMPPSMRDNRIDNTSNIIPTPKVNLNPSSSPKPPGKPMVFLPPSQPQSQFLFRPF